MLFGDQQYAQLPEHAIQILVDRGIGVAQWEEIGQSVYPIGSTRRCTHTTCSVQTNAASKLASESTNILRKLEEIWTTNSSYGELIPPRKQGQPDATNQAYGRNERYDHSTKCAGTKRHFGTRTKHGYMQVKHK